MKVYPLYKKSYVDFDYARYELLAVYYDSASANAKMNELNNSRTEFDINYEISYITDFAVPLR